MADSDVELDEIDPEGSIFICDHLVFTGVTACFPALGHMHNFTKRKPVRWSECWDTDMSG